MSFSYQEDVENDITMFTSSNKKELKKKFKVVVSGDGGIGKTSFLITHNSKVFPIDYIPTVMDNITENFEWKNQTSVELAIWELPYNDEYERLRRLYYIETDFVVLCFDLTNRNSFENLQKYADEARDEDPNIKMIVLGTKSDLLTDLKAIKDMKAKNKKPISNVEIAKKCKELDVYSYIETSAKEGKNVSEVFEEIIRILMESQTLKKKKKNFSFFKKKKEQNPIKTDWDLVLKQCNINEKDRLEMLKKEIKRKQKESLKLYKKYYHKLSHDVVKHILNEFLLIELLSFREFQKDLLFFQEEFGISTKNAKFQHFGYFKDSKMEKNRKIIQLFYSFKLIKNNNDYYQYLPRMKKLVLSKSPIYLDLEQRFFNHLGDIPNFLKEIKGTSKEITNLLFKGLTYSFRHIDFIRCRVKGSYEYESFCKKANQQLKPLKSLYFYSNLEKGASYYGYKTDLVLPNLEILELENILPPLLKFSFNNLKVLKIRTNTDHNMFRTQFNHLLKLKKLEVLELEGVTMKVVEFFKIFELENLRELKIVHCFSTFAFTEKVELPTYRKSELKTIIIKLRKSTIVEDGKIPEKFIKLLKEKGIQYYLEGKTTLKSKDFSLMNRSST